MMSKSSSLPSPKSNKSSEKGITMPKSPKGSSSPPRSDVVFVRTQEVDGTYSIGSV
jgi:hypothetical protein